MKITKDLILYISDMDEKSKKLPKESRDKLENIFSVILQLLIATKKSSNLGKTFFTWQ